MKLWLSHPRGGKSDTMLTLSVGAFVFSAGIVIACFIAALVCGDTSYLSYVTPMVTAFLTPSLSAYALRKFTDNKFSVNLQQNDTENDVKLQHKESSCGTCSR